jgi:DNA ligase-1
MQDMYIKYGDMSDYVYKLYSDIYIPKKKFITISDVVLYKENLNKLSGTESNVVKIKMLVQLIESCNTPLEIKYIIKIFLNKLNIGFSERSLIKCFRDLKTVMKMKEHDSLINYLEKEIFKYKISYDDSNENILKPGQFVNVMLCKPGEDMDSLLKSLKDTKQILAEIKYDGERSQLHFDGTTVEMGSRAFEDQSVLYGHLRDEIQKNILEYNSKQPETKSFINFILDGEIVCFSKKTNAFVNFQELRKKSDGNIDPDKNYFYVAFDILLLNNKNLYSDDMLKRKDILQKVFNQTFDKIVVEKSHLINLDDEVKPKLEKSYNKARKLNCEGLVIKQTNLNYEFGKRKWYKVYKY